MHHTDFSVWKVGAWLASTTFSFSWPFSFKDKNDHIFLALDMVWSNFLVAIAFGLTKLCACQSKYTLCNTFPIASGFMSTSSKYLQPIKLVLILKRSGNAC